MLDEAGFPNAKICASSDLDEQIIRDLRQQGACIDTWGVGTKLITSENCPALGGVYKLAEVERHGKNAAAHQNQRKLLEDYKSRL